MVLAPDTEIELRNSVPSFFACSMKQKYTSVSIAVVNLGSMHLNLFVKKIPEHDTSFTIRNYFVLNVGC